MKLTRYSGTFGLAALAALASPFALAQAQAPAAGWYGGASVGRSAATIDNARITSGLATQGLATGPIDDHDRSTGYKLFGGYQFTPNIGVEAGYFDLGHVGYSATTTPAGTLTGDMRVKGLNLDLVGTMPLFGKLSGLARVGVTSVRSSDSFATTGAVRLPYASATPSQRSVGMKAGVGLMYDITDALAVRAEAERYGLKDAVGNHGHMDLFSVGLIYRFGAHPQTRVVAQAPVAQAPAPIVQAPPPPPPPPPVAAPAPPAPMRVSLSADSLFDFDRSTLKPQGQQALDKLIGDLRGMQYDTIRVTGHTDRLGRHDYNLKLSTRRAEAVSAYLVRSGGISAGKITATGVDGADPVTKADDCKGNKPTRALIACLQPDRRVDVEVTGTR
jgi:OmpA-OmpF porin, OOP family